MANIRVIGLDDDIHEASFITEDGLKIDNSRDLIKALSAPHKDNYEVRMFFAGYDILEGFENLGCKEFYEIFDALIAGNLEYFEVFWKSARKEW